MKGFDHFKTVVPKFRYHTFDMGVALSTFCMRGTILDSSFYGIPYSINAMDGIRYLSCLLKRYYGWISCFED